MLKSLPTLQKLIAHLQRVPYVASKNIYRIASYFAAADDQVIDDLCATLRQVKSMVRPCIQCHGWAEGDARCVICADVRRDTSIICVVETWHDLCAIERAGEFFGLYHVLGGALSPLDGIGIEDLSIESLFSRTGPPIKEVILATNLTPGGEATARFIASKLERAGMTVSRLASGVPTGASLEFMDRVTIHRAIVGRRPF